jgi:hypothetical protein
MLIKGLWESVSGQYKPRRHLCLHSTVYWRSLKLEEAGLCFSAKNIPKCNWLDFLVLPYTGYVQPICSDLVVHSLHPHSTISTSTPFLTTTISLPS